MSPLLARIEEDVKAAMRSGDTVRRDTLRMVLSQIKAAAIERNREPTDEDVIEALLHAQKTRRESVEQFGKGGRKDLVDAELAQLAVLEPYLPKPLGPEEARAAAVEVIRELGATSKRDLGRVMKALLARHKGALDGKLASRVVGELLP
jgi:uncharacterized protein YqeY